MTRTLVDLTGRTFNRWTVIGRAPDRRCRDHGPQVYWICRCACGRNRDVLGNNLKSGKSKSCGRCPKRTVYDTD